VEVVASWGVRDEAGEGGVASVFEREETCTSKLGLVRHDMQDPVFRIY